MIGTWRVDVRVLQVFYGRYGGDVPPVEVLAEIWEELCAEQGVIEPMPPTGAVVNTLARPLAEAASTAHGSSEAAGSGDQHQPGSDGKGSAQPPPLKTDSSSDAGSAASRGSAATAKLRREMDSLREQLAHLT